MAQSSPDVKDTTTIFILHRLMLSIHNVVHALKESCSGCTFTCCTIPIDVLASFLSIALTTTWNFILFLIKALSWASIDNILSVKGDHIWLNVSDWLLFLCLADRTREDRVYRRWTNPQEEVQVPCEGCQQRGRIWAIGEWRTHLGTKPIWSVSLYASLSSSSTHPFLQLR